MVRFLLLYLLFFSWNLSFSQKVEGKVYDDKKVLGEVFVSNLNTGISTLTQANGDFQISASLKDSLWFSMPFYEDQVLVVQEHHLKEKFVIELKSRTNELEEVLVTHAPVKVFDPETYQETFSLQLENDRKERPYLYKPPPSLNFDIFGVLSLLGKALFPPKEKESFQPDFISAEDLQTLFESEHALFNVHLLREELKIPRIHFFLFFTYCEAQEIPYDYLKEENTLNLLERLLQYGPEFISHLEEE